MKQIKLGLLAVALFGAVAAFAGKSATDPGWYTDESLTVRIGDNPPSECLVQPSPVCAVHFNGDEIDGEVNQP